MNTLAKYSALSLLIHLALGALLLVGINLPTRIIDDDPGVGEPVEIPIQAVSADQQQVEQQLDRLRQAEEQEQARQRQIEEDRRRAQEEAERERQRQAEAERQRQEEERRLEELREQQRQEEQRLRELEEQARERQAELERQERERQEEERRRQEEEERRRQEEAERRAEEERQRQAAEEAERQAAEEAERQRRMEAEARQREIERAQTTYGAAIIREVSEAWSRPPGSPTGLSARISISLAPDGSVLNAEVSESSGHAAFDRSAELAVRRASPLSVPSDPEIFSRFRNITFTFTPDEQ